MYRVICIFAVLGTVSPAKATDRELSAAEVAEMEKSLEALKPPVLAELKDPDGKDVAAVAAEFARRQDAGLPRRVMLERLVAAHYTGWKDAAERGNRDALYLCGLVEAFGFRGPENMREACEWYKKAAAAGQPHASNDYATVMFIGEGVPQDKEKAVSLLREYANKGMTPALFTLGLIFTTNGGPEYSAPAEGLRLSWRAALKGHPKAINQVGVCFGRGIGVRENPVIASKWYAKGIEFGNPTCMHNIACNYKAGTGVPRDQTEAAKWYERAALAGNGGSMLQLSVMYYDGLGVEQSRAEAVKWGQRAVDAGAPEAKWWLGKLHAPSPPANFGKWAPAYGSSAHQQALQEAKRAVRDYQQHIMRSNPHLGSIPR